MQIDEIKKALSVSNGRGFHALTKEGKKVVVVGLKTFSVEPEESRTTNLSPGATRIVKKQKFEKKTVCVLGGGVEVAPEELTRV